MGKSRKKLAVLLAATMTVSMMFGMTTFAADDPAPNDPATLSDAADTDSPVPGPETEPVLTGAPTNTEEPGIVPAAPTTPDETLPDNTIPDDGNAPGGNTVPGDDTVPGGGTVPGGDTVPGDDTIPNDEDENLPADDPTGGGVNVPEEEPTEVKIAGSDNLTKSDTFVSLGEGKGSYQYNGESLILKDAQIEIDGFFVDGITITGNLVIILEGNNAIIVGATSEGIEISNGDLTIKGDGTLSISNKLGGYQPDEDNYYYEGIYNPDGDITIDGATVNVDVYSDSSYENSAIYAGGDINILNGANVTAKSTAMGEEDLTHYGIYSNGGKISIIDSNVTASADGKISLEDEILQAGIGLYSRDLNSLRNLEADCLSGIVIDNSNVRSTGSFASMLVIGRDGTITIDGSTIVSPEGVNVRDLMAVIGGDPDAAASVIGAILATGEGPIDMDAIMEKIDSLNEAGDEEALLAYLDSLFGAIAKDVNIIRNSELQTEKAGIPVTGDSYHVEFLILGLIAAGAVSAYLIRKRMMA